jgi:hypothetical protein
MRFATALSLLALTSAALLGGCGSSSDDSTGGGATASPPASTSTAPAGASAHECGRYIGGVRALRATGLSCADARHLAYFWVTERTCRPASGASRSACALGTYRCVATATGRGYSVSCAHPGRSVAFRVGT